MGDASGRPEVSRDARLGKLALEWGWISALQLREALAEQESENPRRPLGVILVTKGLLSDARLSQLLEQLSPRTPSFPPFGKYDLLREIGRGAMGVVYEAQDTELRRRVALKMLISPPRPDPLESKPEDDRFLRESQLHKSLPPHPGIVPVLEAGVFEGRRYLAMELVEGAPLGAWQRAGSVTMRQRIALLRDVALAVHHAHQHGVIHRDLKPENILVDRTHRPRITDFGLAKMLGSAVQPLLTVTGTALGTPAYMSPEQVKGQKDLDARTDVYSLGVMLYELLTGRRPFQGETAYEIMMKTVNEDAVPPSHITSIQINPVLYKNVENICLIALSKDPKDRYPTAAAFANDLTSWLKGEDIRAVVPKKWRLWRSRKQAIRLATGAAILAALAAVAVYLRTRPEPAPIRTAATVKAETLQPGGIAEYYAGLNFNALGLRKIDTRNAFDDPSQPLWRDGQGGWTSRRWFGYLQVRSSGTYLFDIRADERARLVIDGIELYAGTTAMTREASLSEGPHKFLLEHAHGGTNDTVSISMRKSDAPPAAAEKLGPGSLFHSIKDFKPVSPQSPFRNWMSPVPGAEEGETITVLEHSGHPPQRKGYAYYASFWKGTWSGAEHLWWGPGVKIGDKLRVRFAAGENGRETLAVGLTRASDHGIFKVSVNGVVVAESLDLYSHELLTHETEFRNVELKAGPNELEFEVVGSNPSALEWGTGTGVFKMGLDYVLVR
ncbi:MAG TPA: protein kinase [Planctomycetota bacterium]|nr:protein kinase [Planctomycetota bacterium]